MEIQSFAPNIGVKNVNETVKFYIDVLGFKLIMSNPQTGVFEWAMVGMGNVVVMFQEEQSLKQEYPALQDKQAGGLLTFYVKMINMMQLYEKVKGTKHLAKDLNKTLYGADEFAVTDNNGHILTVTEYR